jgi:L-2,4-diaminobutyrate decarboxylase
MLSLPVYTLLYQYGTSLFSAYINRVNYLGQYVYGKLRTNNHWEVPVPPSCNIICFRFLPSKSTHLMDINHLNKYIREQIILEGNFYIVQTVLSENVFLRLSITNALTTEADLDALLDAAMGYANRYISN